MFVSDLNSVTSDIVYFLFVAVCSRLYYKLGR
jgi:hypothetical protein